MPSLETCPRVLLMTGVDLRAWAGLEVFAFGGAPVVLPAWGGAGEGIFTDALDAFGARQSRIAAGVPTDFVAQAAAAWAAGGWPAATFTGGLNATDRVFLNSTEAFQFRAPFLGFPDWLSSTLSLGLHRVAAPQEWGRGILRPEAKTFQIRQTAFDVAQVLFTVANAAIRQSVPAWVRTDAPGDIDVPAHTDLSRLTTDAIGRLAQWGIDEDGHAFLSAVTSSVGDLSWTSLSFRERLGFSGSEVASVLGGPPGRYVITASRPCPGVLAPSRPLAEPLSRWREDVPQVTRTLGGRVYRTSHSGLLGWRAQVWLDGLLDEGDDLWDHYLSQWLPYADDSVCLALEAGDTRRRGAPWTAATYGTLYTTQDAGLRGRLVGSLAPDHETRQTLDAQQGLYYRAPVTCRIVEREDA